MNYKPYRHESTRSSVLNGIENREDQQAWARFFDTYAGYVFGIARNRGLPEADSHEIVQNVMLELCQGESLRKFDRTKGRFRSWLSQLVVWRIGNYLETSSAVHASESCDPAKLVAIPENKPSTLEQDFEAEWQETVLAEALRQLQDEVNPDHYKIYYASAIEGLGFSSIQRIYGVSADNLYQIRRRLGTRFKALLEKAMRELDNPDIT